MLRLYLDEDAMSAGLIRALSGTEIEAVTAAQEGLRGRDDPEEPGCGMTEVADCRGAAWS